MVDLLFLLFYISKILRAGVLFMVLSPGFVLRCSFVAPTDVVLYPTMLLGLEQIFGYYIWPITPTHNTYTATDVPDYTVIKRSLST
jgi:hypothetical protein